MAEFTLPEQIACIDRQISFQERVIKVYENDDPTELAKAKHELSILRSIRETIQDGNAKLRPALRRKNRKWSNQYVQPF